MTNTSAQTITHLTKPRHRGFLSQLLCCFRPTNGTTAAAGAAATGSNHCDHDSTNGIYNIIHNINNSNDLTSTHSQPIQHQLPSIHQQQQQQSPNQHHQQQSNQQQQQIYSENYLLPTRKPSDNRICLVIDLDETLVHSSFKPIEKADFVVPVEIDGISHKVYVLKRPHVDEFLARVGKIFECVLFTASLAKYADPVADLLDPHKIFNARLFRESCAFYRGNYVKDLGRLGRDLNRVIIVDNSPASYIFHPENALPVSSYFDDENDKELLNLITLLENVANKTGAVVPIEMCYIDNG